MNKNAARRPSQPGAMDAYAKFRGWNASLGPQQLFYSGCFGYRMRGLLRNGEAVAIYWLVNLWQ